MLIFFQWTEDSSTVGTVCYPSFHPHCLNRVTWGKLTLCDGFILSQNKGAGLDGCISLPAVLACPLASAGLGGEVGDMGAKVLRPGMKAWQRSAHRVTLLAGVVSTNWQGEEEINL